MLRAFLRALFAEQRRRARQRWGVPRSPCGAVTFLQRFGSALNANLHFHTLALDGVYARTERRLTHFLALPPPSRPEVARVLAGTARRIARRLDAIAAGSSGSAATWRGRRSRAIASKSGPTDASRSASRLAGATERRTS